MAKQESTLHVLIDNTFFTFLNLISIQIKYYVTYLLVSYEILYLTTQYRYFAYSSTSIFSYLKYKIYIDKDIKFYIMYHF